MAKKAKNLATERVGETLTNNFGSVMYITEYRNNKDMDVYFPDYDWTAHHVSYKAFEKGSIKCPYEKRVFGVACMGDGPHKSAENGIHTSAYKAWMNMLRRCYDPAYQELYPTYKGCSVDSELLNYQVFAEWYYSIYYEIPGQKMCLDKDILVKGNKVYSKETCVLVPHSINALFIKADEIRGDCPIGVYYFADRDKYMARCTMNGETKYLGMHETAEEAFIAYKTFKEALIQNKATEYMEYIPYELYEAMMEYEVEIDD